MALARFQLPAVKLMAPHLLAPPHQQAIADGGGLAVAKAEAAAGCAEGQQPGHHLPLPFGIAELPAEQQQPTAFSRDRHPGGCGLSLIHI